MAQKRARIRILILLVVLAGGGWAAVHWRAKQRDRPTDRIVLYGNIDVRQVALAINGNERIASVMVEEGDLLKKGQVLARLETDRLEPKVARQEALVAAQEQIVARLVAGSRPEEIRMARADFAATEASIRDAVARLKRTTEAVASHAVSEQALDDAKTAVDTAKANAAAAKAKLDLVVAGPRKEDIAEARAQLARCRADLALVRQELEDATLVAPSAAVVQERILEVGDMANPSKPVYTVALIDPVWVRAYIAEPDLGKVREGMQAEVSTDSFPGKVYEGWVGFISPTAEFTPKPVETSEVRTKLVYQARIFVRNPAGELRLGMPATVTIRIPQAPATPGDTRTSAPK